MTEGVVEIAAATTAPVRSSMLYLRGDGCAKAACDIPIRAVVRVRVLPLAAGPGRLSNLPIPSSARSASAARGVLADELLVAVGSADRPGTREEAEAAARDAGGVIAGGLTNLGIYQVRWRTAQNLGRRAEELRTNPGVDAVALATVDSDQPADALSTQLPTALDRTYWTWRYNQIDAPEAWSIATGGSVEVGIVDVADVWAGHPDLHVARVLGVLTAPGEHATHVAGLACGAGGAQGMVGIARGCPIVTASAGAEPSTDSELDAMQALTEVRGVRVVNASLDFGPGGGCARTGDVSRIKAYDGSDAPMFRRLFVGPGSKIVWVFSAGNDCLGLVASAFGLSFDLPNVLTVAATNSNRTLAAFSDYGPDVNVAAPGGVYIPSGPISDDTCLRSEPTTEEAGRCGLLSTTVGCAHEPARRYCPAEGELEGTSMAAPIVAGVAALVISRHPRFAASQVGECIKTTAGTEGVSSTEPPDGEPEGWKPFVPFSGGRIPIVNAAAAVRCTSGGASRSSSPVTVGTSQCALPNGVEGGGSLKFVATGIGCAQAAAVVAPVVHDASTCLTSAEGCNVQGFTCRDRVPFTPGRVSPGDRLTCSRAVSTIDFVLPG